MNSVSLGLTAIALGATLLAAPGTVSADLPQSAATLANILETSGIAAGSGFTVTRTMSCGKARDPQDPSLHCTTFFADAGRDSRPAYLQIMVFDRVADFEVKAGKIKAAVEADVGRWVIEWDPDVTLSNSNAGTRAKLRGHCYQKLGVRNGDAFCLFQANSRALVYAQVKPKHTSTDSITIGRGSDSYDDARHATDLAVLGAIAVAKASK